ncbi:hypothetical protein DPMN_084116 [Dreissena polymorpha]|uniref:B box-type domain-containing protein n=1 Tax=Dreissena polymorpha TaxID=45954 RepID=A0A9D4BIA6_DREPO|nr:hypothetical protein DPMN_084116 [Dreissena polymorpha]
MATFWHCTNKKGSETVQDYLCSTCQEKTIEERADFYCKSCINFYCQKCIYKHDLLFTKHSLYGRGDIKAWPVDEKMEDFLLKCDNHKEEKLTMFCEDHSQLCCCNCAVLQHSLCKKVTLISDYVKNNSTDLQQMSVKIQTILEEIKKLQDNEASIRSVHSSYDAQLNKIQATRRKINEVLDEIEKETEMQ